MHRIPAYIASAAIFAAALASGPLASGPRAAAAQSDPSVTCNGELPQQGVAISVGDDGTRSQPDVVVVTGSCTVSKLGEYHYGEINVVAGGSLVFVEPPQQDPGKPNETNFWAESIVIENGGAVMAGVPVTDGGRTTDHKPYGSNGNVLNIVLYGKDRSGDDPVNKPAQGVACHQENCGIPKEVWEKGAEQPVAMPGAGGVQDYFYAYHPLKYDDADHDRYFGYKVLALSYGGTLQLRGLKGTAGAEQADTDPTDPGTSWLRLAADLTPGSRELTLSRDVSGSWRPGDRVVVTSTDYLPNHSEEFTIAAVNGSKVSVAEAAKYFHNGTKFDLSRLKSGGTGYVKANAGSPLLDSAETRAGVALLTRSIRIVSGGDEAGEHFDWENEAQKEAAAGSAHPQSATERNPRYQFGAHFLARQGFAKLQVQGVEFRWMGQGGRIGHYPVHFHMARRVPSDTYIKDSAVNESMTRWYVLHATQGATLQRNVGYKSIGHGYYLEDATETDNSLYANIGIFARGGVSGPDNPRDIPGILSWRNDSSRPGNTDPTFYVRGGDWTSRVRSDVLYPTAFWITNGWNDFVGNMAAGSNMCGTCYWLVPASDNANMSDWKWSGYSRLQQRFPGSAALKQFHGNSCSSSMHALNVVAATSNCEGVDSLPNDKLKRIEQVPVSYAPQPKAEGRADGYYPNMTGYRQPTACSPSAKLNDPADTCLTVNQCMTQDPKDCATTVIDSFTTSFNWAETNFGAIWMRSGWNLVDRLFMSDILNGGIGMISGGDYTRSSVPVGYWGVLGRSVFVGSTQPGNSYAAPSGPVYPAGHAEAGKSLCDDRDSTWRYTNSCPNKANSVAWPLSNWSTNRMVNIYDGPFYQFGNAYLDIATSECNDDKSCFWLGTLGVRRVPSPQGARLLDKGYLPNAAIGWKQPNGFYYPPAFHSADLHFDKVGIRHYLTVPLFDYGTYRTDQDALNREFVDRNFTPYQGDKFSNFTDVDRQTVLNDLDGTLTGFRKTISLNQDPFFAAPLQVPECLSLKDVLPANSACPTPTQKTLYRATARTSPYDHVTVALQPECAITNTSPVERCGSRAFGGTWSKDCGGPHCFGVRLYRQYLTGGSDANPREWQAWKTNGCEDPANAGKAECDRPFIRLAGGGLWQRSGLTANHGTYYLDTTRTRQQQIDSDALSVPKTDTARSVSVFEGNQAYYMFLLFARGGKQDYTKQTYQIWVGSGFDPKSGVKAIQMKLPDLSFKQSDIEWPAGWTREMVAGPDGVKDVLEVTMDFSSLPASIDLDPKTSPDTCKPASFCKRGSSGSCGCALGDDSPLLRFGSGVRQSCEAVCSKWAVIDVDYPEGGAVGFSFKLPGDFHPDGRNHRPPAKRFPTDENGSPWKNTGFDGLSDKSAAGACFYEQKDTPTLAGSCQARD